MAKNKHRPRGSGSVRVIRGNVYARWRESGLDFWRPAESEREAEGTLAYIDAMRKRHRLTLRAALERFDAESAPQGPAPTPAGQPFAELLDLYLDDCDRTAALRESTRRANRERSGILRGAPWASMPLEGIRRRDARAWVAGRMASGVSGKSIVNDLTLASAVWRFAEERGLVDDDANNVFLKARPRRYARKQRQALEPRELLALRDAVREQTPDAYPLFLGALFSGWRVGELCGLREADLDLDLDHEDGSRLTIDPEREKTGKSKVSYIGEPLVSLLRAEREARPRLPTALVFTTRTGRRWTPWTRLDRLRTALAAVPLDVLPAVKRDGDDTRLGCDWHTLRHSVSTLLNARGHRDAAIGELLGQADVATRRRYTHPYRVEALAIAADMVAFLEPPKGGEATAE